jgi:hypothetical protein
MGCGTSKEVNSGKSIAKAHSNGKTVNLFAEICAS